MPRGRPARKQGQLLAYVFCYAKIHRFPPSENEVAGLRSIRGPSAHRMTVTLEEAGSSSRDPGQSRTLKVLLPRDDLPELE